MRYDIEREQRKSEEIRVAFRECFPLAPVESLPWAACQIKRFLSDRIEQESKYATSNFVSEVAKVLLEISPPKTHVVDMARIVVTAVREAEAALRSFHNEAVSRGLGEMLELDDRRKVFRWRDANVAGKTE